MQRASYRTLIRGLAIWAMMVCASGAQAASSGLSVELRSGEAKDAAAAGTVKLYGASHALVIGNDAYGGAWPRLSNAIKDARLITRALRAKGFKVTLKTDLNSRDLIEAFEAFFYETGQDPDARLFVWYAGHGYSERSEGSSDSRTWITTPVGYRNSRQPSFGSRRW